MKKYLLVALAVLILVVTGYGMPQERSGPRAWADNDGRDGQAGASSYSTNNMDIGYAKVSGPTALDTRVLTGTVYKSEVGLVSVQAQSDSAPVKASTRFGVAGVEIGSGAMGRAVLTDATVNLGPANLNLGIGVDTGIIVDRGLEAKFLGVGGKVGADGVEVCFVVCFGFSW